jgi:hypothetical protein
MTAVYDDIEKRVKAFFIYGQETDFDALLEYVLDVYVEGYEQGYEEGCND